MKQVVEVPARRGHWVAYVEGNDPKYGLSLDVSDGVLVKSRKIRQHTFTKPCIIAVGQGTDGKCGECGTPKKKRSYFVVTGATLEAIPAGVDIAAITEAPAPGQPGSYGHHRCACGADVARYDANMLPMCAEHAPTVKEDLPIPVGVTS